MRLALNILFLTVGILFQIESFAQCDPYFKNPHSIRNANYEINLQLDHEKKKILATEQLIWINTSPDTLNEMRFYMYLNSFKNMESTFMKSANNIFGQDITKRTSDTWGWIDITKLIDSNGSSLEYRYIQPSDDNTEDQSILSVALKEELLPNDTLILNMNFEAKMPKTIARMGYAKDDFFMFVHWFPQACPYVTKADGTWAWNSHQAHRRTEFFADFGNYDVKITTDKKFILGASGCLVSQIENSDNTITSHYHGEDLIDFAWTAYPSYEVMEDQWKHVYIRLLIPGEHCTHGQRLIQAVKNSLEYFEKHVGEYPYTYLTMVDPPMKGLRSGFMEYPTFITGGSFYAWPSNIRSIESLMIHEFSHQYFMGMVASNEKEEAWLDEGFVTFYEDCIMEEYYGKDQSLFNICGYAANNSSFTRNEYTSLDNLSLDIINQPGWKSKGDTKPIVYAKTATMLQTLKRLAGEEAFDKMMKNYFNRWKFKHPKSQDFYAVANEYLTDLLESKYGMDLNSFLDQSLNTTRYCDFKVGQLRHIPIKSKHGWFGNQDKIKYQEGKKTGHFLSKVRIEQLGTFEIPVEIEFYLDNGNVIKEIWNGKGRSKDFVFEGPSKVKSVHIDPEQKIFIDVDLNNNSYFSNPIDLSIKKYSAKAIYWFQNALQTVGFLF